METGVFIISILFAALRAGTPLLIVTLGEILAEKVGVLNLGLEGMMLMGALSGFVAAYVTSDPWGDDGGNVGGRIDGLAACVRYGDFACQPGGQRPVVDLAGHRIKRLPGTTICRQTGA